MHLGQLGKGPHSKEERGHSVNQSTWKNILLDEYEWTDKRVKATRQCRVQDLFPLLDGFSRLYRLNFHQPFVALFMLLSLNPTQPNSLTPTSVL